MPDETLYGSLVTDVGTKKLAEAAKYGRKLDLVKFQVGDGNGEYYLPTKDQLELKNKVYESEIDSYQISPHDEKLILVKCQVPSSAGPFTIREWGLVDADGDLIAVSNVSDITVVPYQTGEIINLRIEIYIQFDNQEIGGVNIVVNPTTEELLKQDILEEIEYKLEHVKMWEADEEDIASIFDFAWVPPDGDYEEATEEDIKSLFNK